MLVMYSWIMLTTFEIRIQIEFFVRPSPFVHSATMHAPVISGYTTHLTRTHRVAHPTSYTLRTLAHTAPGQPLDAVLHSHAHTPPGGWMDPTSQRQPAQPPVDARSTTPAHPQGTRHPKGHWHAHTAHTHTHTHTPVRHVQSSRCLWVRRTHAVCTRQQSRQRARNQTCRKPAASRTRAAGNCVAARHRLMRAA